MEGAPTASRGHEPRTWFMRIVGAKTPLQAKTALWGYIYLLPWLIGLFVFLVGPIVASAYFSLTEYEVMSPPKWVGLANYSKAFTGDKLFWSSLARTLPGLGGHDRHFPRRGPGRCHLDPR